MSETRQKHAILYVDDEWANRIVFEQNFNDRFRVVCAGSGPEALERMGKDSIACLVTDQRMPEMTGNELLRLAKEQFPQVIRVVVTAYSDLDPILKAVNDGLVARYIVKPWVKEELDKVLDWALEVFTIGAESSAVQLRLIKSERLITLGSMAGSVLHEIRNLISPAKNNAAYLRDAAQHSQALATLLAEHGKSLPEAARSALADLAEELPSLSEDMVEGIAKLEDVLVSYRKVLKDDSGTKGTADPKEAIRYALTLLRPMVKGIEIDFDGPERLPRVGLGQTELTQVMINLGQNAVQAFPKNAFGRVSVVASVENGQVAFAISDNGPGIPPDVLAKVGTAFFTTKEEGTGLGIAQCRRLVANAGGEFSLESTVGKGTTVRFHLPIAS